MLAARPNFSFLLFLKLVLAIVSKTVSAEAAPAFSGTSFTGVMDLFFEEPTEILQVIESS